jgi:DNA-binding response OmpR family regulator
MREMNLLDRTPTLVLTARKQPGDVQRAISLGARDFLTKPFSDVQLISRVARLLKKAPNIENSDDLPHLSPGGIAGATQVRLI